MNWFRKFLVSSVGRKFVMGLTGIFLITFLIVHCSINSMIFFNDGGVTFNKAAHFMGTNVIIRTVEIFLFLGLILHIVQAYILALENRKARPVQYNVNNPAANSRWYSRSMTLLGTLLLIFLIIHINHFWTNSRLGGLLGIKPLEHVEAGGKEVLNLYAEMLVTFESPLVIVIYILGVISLCWHLIHGFQSAFQTFGLHHKKYTPLVKQIGVVFSVLISLIFVLMPVSMHFGWIK